MKRKIRPSLHALKVESFDTGAGRRDRGTVHANHAASGASCTCNCTLDEPTCTGPACRTVPALTCLC
jgi:hypothetical protein